MTTTESMRSIIAAEPLVETSVIERYRKVRPTLVVSLVDAFLVEGQRYFQELRTAVASADAAGAKSAAHGLKSCSLNLGAVRLAKVCQQTEHVASGGDQKEIASALSFIGPILFDTEDALKGIRSQSQSKAGAR